MVTQFNINKSLLPRLRNELPHGAIEVIAERTGYTPHYVRQFFKGLTTVNRDNVRIIREAKKVIDEQARESASLEKDILAMIPAKKSKSKKSA